MALTKVVRDISFTTAGFDSGNARWNDVSGRANHIPHTAGTHAVSTVSSHEAWEPALDSTEYSEFSPCKPAYTILMVIYHNSTTNPVNYWWGSGADSGAPYAADDHAALTEPATWLDQDAGYIRGNNTSMINGCISGATATATISVGAWSIVTASFDPFAKTVKIQINDGSPTVTAATAAQIRQNIFHRVRLGYFNASTTINGGAAYGRFVEIEGDAFADQSVDLAAEITAMKTEYGIA